MLRAESNSGPGNRIVNGTFLAEGLGLASTFCFSFGIVCEPSFLEQRTFRILPEEEGAAEDVVY